MAPVLHIQPATMFSRHALSQARWSRACPSHGNLVAPCSLACETLSCTLVSPQHCRLMPCSRAKRHRTCPERLSAIASCPLAAPRSSHHAHLARAPSRHALLTATRPSLMLIWLGRHLVMPTRGYKAIAHPPAAYHLVAADALRLARSWRF